MTIRKVKGGWRVVSKSGRNMGTSKTKHGAHVREGQVNWFKKHKGRKK